MTYASVSARSLVLSVLLLLTGCIESYQPDVLSAPRALLVIDGFINAQGVTTINLSRTYAVNSGQAPPKEVGATVAIEEEGGGRYELRETAPGTYASTPLTLNRAKKHRLRLQAAGHDYASDFVPVLTSPPIDQVSWVAGTDGLSVYVDSHDAANATRYYRWETEESWEIVPVLYPQYEYRDGDVRPIAVRFPQKCWPLLKSTTINVAKTTNLSQDVVSHHLVGSVEKTSSRLYYKYSILVRQYAQSREEYTYWELLKKNTESIGTLFDPLPVQLTGNVHNLSDATEPVLGYVGAHSTTEKRLFIDRAELPGLWRVLNGYENCIPPDTIDKLSVHVRFANHFIVPVEKVFWPENDKKHPEPDKFRGYTAATPDCVDCRTRGTAIKPDFWP